METVCPGPTPILPLVAAVELEELVAEPPETVCPGPTPILPLVAPDEPEEPLAEPPEPICPGPVPILPLVPLVALVAVPVLLDPALLPDWPVLC